VDRYVHQGLTFDVTDEGPADGEVVILLHGYPEDRTSWSEVTPKLVAEGYRTLAPDQRGYSPEARPRGRRAYVLDALAGDVIALADAAGAERVHLVGHDWGAGAAWVAAALHPERVASLTSLATPHPSAMTRAMLTSTQGLRSWYMFFYQLPWLPEQSAAGFGAPVFRRTLIRSGLPVERAERYLTRLREPGAATGAINWYRGALISPRRPLPITVPTLYVYGSADFALGRTAAELTARYVEGPYQFEVLEGVGHWMPETEPDAVSARLIPHIASNH